MSTSNNFKSADNKMSVENKKRLRIGLIIILLIALFCVMFFPIYCANRGPRIYKASFTLEDGVDPAAFNISNPEVDPNKDYETKLTVTSNQYMLPEALSVKSGSTDVTNYTYNIISATEADFKIAKDSIKGDVVITVKLLTRANNVLFTFNGENCTLTNKKSLS